MTLDRIDLNLLRIFAAVYEERGVTAAARRLGLEQPTVSNALNRLRAALDDELFQRTPTGMVPTPRAEAMAGPILRALGDLRAAVQPAPSFDPSRLTGMVTFALSSAAEAMLGPALLSRLRADAPKLAPVFLPADGAAALESILDGTVELAFGTWEEVPTRLSALTLATQGCAVLLHPGHKAAGGRWTLRRYLGLRHLRTGVPGPADRAVDAALAARPADRRIAAVPGHALTALGLLKSGADLAWTLPAGEAAVLAAAHGLIVRPVELDGAEVALGMVWHRRADLDGRSLWLRRLAAEAARPSEPPARG